MNLHHMLERRADEGRPVRVGLIGAGKFGAMFLNQVRRTCGLHLVGIADLSVDRARQRCGDTDWPAEQTAAASFDEAAHNGSTHITDDAHKLIESGLVDVLVEATGDPAAGIRHCLGAIEHRVHVVMVNVEADVLAGPLLADRARAAGVLYSLAWGDQPALICEHVDWARACGFEVICAGKGTRYHPSFHQSTPDTVWDSFGFDAQEAERGGMNAKMFNSFIDGTKSAIEMTAVCNATGLRPQRGGLQFPPVSCWELANVCKPKGTGGVLEHAGTTEVVSSLNRDKTPIPNDLMFGTYVVIEAPNDYARRCFAEYKMLPDESGHFAALFRPTHMIGLELGISIASVALRAEPTGAPTGFRSDVVAIAKRALRAGETLDGEGGYCVWGRQVPAEVSLREGLLPIGLAHNVRATNDIAEGRTLRWRDVVVDEDSLAVRTRRQMEAATGDTQNGTNVGRD